MNFNIKIITTAVIAMILGIVAGYLIFNDNQNTISAGDTHNHVEDAGETSGENEIWTCSMHPQIRQNEPGLCPICGMDLIPLETNSNDDPLVLEMTKEAVKLANIQTTTIGQVEEYKENSIRLSGKIQADERLASGLVSHISGRIEKLYVTFTGEEVVQGQKLASVYSPELVTAQRELLEALKLQDVNPGLLKAARDKLRYWKIGDKAIEAVEQIGEIQETFTIYADKPGIVTKRRVSVGDYIKRGESLFDLINLKKVWVLFDAYEKDLSNISVGDEVEFTVVSIPEKTFKTRITFIDPVINPDTRIAVVRAEAGNSRGLLKPEMFVTGILKSSGAGKKQLTVPKSAVLWTGKRSVIYIKLPEMAIPSFKFKEVELGESLGDSYVLISGLERGEEVVTNGNFAIDASAQLNNQTSMMNKRVKIKGTENVENLPDFTESAPLEFKRQLLTVSEAYISLKDALVATDAKQAAETATGLLKSLKNVDMTLLKGEAHMYWMKQLNAIKTHTEKITTQQDVEEQRKQFDFLSQPLIKTVKVFGIPEGTFYVQHCPMAFDNRGADWISEQKEIRNPYFGDKMLKCGKVIDSVGIFDIRIEQ